MKMKLWLILLSLCVFMLFACGSDHGTTSDTTDGSGSFRSVTETGFPKAPPTLTVVCGEESVTAWRGTYSWHVLLDNGMGSGKHADSMHPLTAGDAVPVITAGDGAEVTLVFEIPAEIPLPLTSLEVRRYPADAEAHEDYETVTAEGGVLTLTEDNALYEVIAAWDVSDGAYSGTVHYAFRVHDPHRIVDIAYEKAPEEQPSLSFEMIYEDEEYQYCLPDAADGEDAVTYANGEVVRIKDAAAAGHVTLTDLLQEQIYCFMISKTMPEPDDSNVLYIIDRSEGHPFSDVTEPFFEDDNHVYTFGVPKFGYVTVVYKDGRFENVRDALVNGSIVISDLDRFGIQYDKTPKTR